MLFNSAIFLFAFLPVALAGYWVLVAGERATAGRAFLVAASLFFYGYWEARYVLIILLSIAFNYAVGSAIRARGGSGSSGGPGAAALVATGVAANLLLLGYYKYTNFLIDTLADLSDLELHVRQIVLPIGISFFTFQQIAYLVDCRRGQAEDRGILNYALFVAFFPQLIAGPIVHHAEMMPQFARPRLRGLLDNLAVGLTIFAIGLFKKVVLADGIALGSTPVFAAAEAGATPDLFQAWQAALCYTFQIYFDFSGYSDMAIGLGRMFGVRLPINFASPYKATSIIDFWRRWHITLSRFLRDYLYIPLGGNRRGPARRLANVMITMALGGIWHGAGWTFLLWGVLHGAYLVTNQAWRRTGWHLPGGRPTAWVLTFALVVLAWVPFRAESWAAASRMYAGLFGWGPSPAAAASLDPDMLIGIAICLAIALFLPNTQQWMRRFTPGLPSPGYPATAVSPVATGGLPTWRPTAGGAFCTAILFSIALMKFNDISEFIYFQF